MKDCKKKIEKNMNAIDDHLAYINENLRNIQILIDECNDPEPTPGAICIGTPSLARYPKMDEADCLARSVYDMQFFENRIFISGGGDSYANRGPVDLFSLSGNRCIAHVKELDEESLSRFRVCGDTLLIPGDDHKGSGTGYIYSLNYVNEVNTWGNYAYTAVGNWGERRLPGNHVIDAAIWRDSTYAIMDNSKFYKTGATTELLAKGDKDTRFEALCATEAGLFMWGRDENLGCIWKVFDDDMLRKLDVFPYPGLEDMFNRPSRVIAWQGGALYASTIALGKHTKQATKLFFFGRGDVSVQWDVKDGSSIKDIVPCVDRAYVLTAAGKEAPFIGKIQKVGSEFKQINISGYQAVPYSLELLNGKYYVGLGNARKQALESSGEVWEITV